MSREKNHDQRQEAIGKDEDQKETGFFNRIRAGDKTNWDWLNFIDKLAIPLVVLVAPMRTLTALQGLDPQRKGVLVQFLYETNLIWPSDQFGRNIHPPIIILFSTDLTSAHLSGTNITQQLDQVKSCQDATLFNGLTCHHT